MTPKMAIPTTKGTHNGEQTQTHDHEIWPVNLSPRNKRNKRLLKRLLFETCIYPPRMDSNRLL